VAINHKKNGLDNSTHFEMLLLKNCYYTKGIKQTNSMEESLLKK